MTPAAAARSAEKSASASRSRNRKTKKITNSSAARPTRNPASVRGSSPPNSASIRSSRGVTAAPTARAAANTTPMAASVTRPVACSSCQTRSVPIRSVAAPPTSGLIFSKNATPRPGSARCEMTSPASSIRRISANEPTSPAATAKSRASRIV